MDETTYSLTELADAADVSTRTIRYYISEGLLAPPAGVGHASRYTTAHLTRLRQIADLKAQYLPLREIRNRLGDPPMPHAISPTEPSSRSSARDYLRTLRRDSAPGIRPRHSAEEDAGVAYNLPESIGAPMAAPMMSPPPGPHDVSEDADAPDVLPEDLAPPGRAWRRIPIGDSAELVIADDLFRRRRDKVEWLIRWARKVIT